MRVIKLQFIWEIRAKMGRFNRIYKFAGGAPAAWLPIHAVGTARPAIPIVTSQPQTSGKPALLSPSSTRARAASSR